MNTGVVITALVILVICVSPFLLIGISNRRKNDRLIKALVNMPTSDKEPWQYELLHHTVIGINKGGNRLAMVKCIKGRLSEFLLNIPEVQDCRINTVSHSLKNHEGYDTIVTDRIELVFTPVDKGKPVIRWELYNINHDSSVLRGEAEFADRWALKVSREIKNLLRWK